MLSMKRVVLASMVFLLSSVAGFADTASTRPAKYKTVDKSGLKFVKGSMTIAMLPDTQNYIRNDASNKIFKSMTTWIRDNAKARNIKMALHVGDIVDNNYRSQWNRARESMSILNDKVAYVLALGNHDLGVDGSTKSRDTFFNDFFKIEDNKLNKQACKGVYQKGRMDNACYTFEDKTGKYLVLSLEFGPRDGVVEWANGIVKKYPRHKAILLTHAFLDELSRKKTGTPLRAKPETPGSARRYAIAKLAGGANCGQELWDKMVCKHKNFYMTLSGHYKDQDGDGIATGHRSDKGLGGNVVNQILFNSQWIKSGGDGWIRLIEIRPDGTIANRTYSPWLKKWRVGPEFEFVLGDGKQHVGRK